MRSPASGPTFSGACRILAIDERHQDRVAIDAVDADRVADDALPDESGFLVKRDGAGIVGAYVEFDPHESRPRRLRQSRGQQPGPRPRPRKAGRIPMPRIPRWAW